MNELISIIIPVYNVEEYIDDCMKSVLKQSYTNIEIILVDDGATDGSGNICDSYAKCDERVKVIHKENGGLSDARNKGIALAKGKFIMFVDSDDVISIDLVEYLYRLLFDNKADIAICDLVHWYQGKKNFYDKESFCHVFTSDEAIVEMLYQKSFLVSACGKIYKKEFFDDVTFPYGMLFEDSAIMHRIFDKAEKIVYGNAKLYGYMHREGSITTKKFSQRDCDIWYICNQITDYMACRSELLIKAARHYKLAAALRIYMNAPKNKDFTNIVRECQSYIKQNSHLVLKDSNIRNKMRVALMLYIYARPIMPLAYKFVNRWK